MPQYFVVCFRNDERLKLGGGAKCQFMCKTVNKRESKINVNIHSCLSQSDDDVSGTSGGTIGQTLMHRHGHTPGRLWQLLHASILLSFQAWRLTSSGSSHPSTKACVPLWVADLQALRSAARLSQPMSGMSQARQFLQVPMVAGPGLAAIQEG